MQVRVHALVRYPDDVEAVGFGTVEDHVPLDGEPAIALPDLVAGSAPVRISDKTLHGGVELAQVLLGLGGAIPAEPRPTDTVDIDPWLPR